MASTRIVKGAEALATQFDAFILDQWGVLHDGRRPYPGVLDALARLKEHGKRIVLLSNSGRRADYSRRHLAELGFDVSAFDAIVTSGEAGFEIVRGRDRPPFDRLGPRCFLITRDGDRTVVEDTSATIVPDVEDADFVFLSGVDSPGLTPEDYYPAIEEAARRKLPVICSNPDLFAPTDGGLVFAPGLLAARYQELGGEVFYIGKPYPPVYEACLRELPGIPRERMVAIGDSLDHDIKGANGMGIPCAFVMDGLHADRFRPLEGDPGQTAEVIEELAEAHGARPEFALPVFKW